MRKILDRLINPASAANSDLGTTPKFQDTASSLEALLSSPGVKGSDQLALEPRILLDAAGVDTAEVAMNEVVGAQVEAWAANLADNDNQPDMQNASEQASKEILFIDEAVEDRETILSQVHPSIEVVVLHSDRDGVEQMASALAGRSDLDAIHIVSHGRSGTLVLGSAKLTEISMGGKHADEMALIRASLANDADLLIYGCDFGAGTRGANAIAAFASRLGGLLQEREQLVIRAPFHGYLENIDPELHTGQWVGVDRPLALFRSPLGSRLVGVVSADDVSRIQEGAGGVFIPDNAMFARKPVRLTSVSAVAEHKLEHDILADIEGGAVPTIQQPDGSLEVQGSWFRVEMQLSEDANQLASPDTMSRGITTLEGEPRSLLAAGFRQVASVLIRESGF